MDRKLTSSVYSFIENHKLFTDAGTVIIVLSGGPDSVFLLHLLAPLHRQGKLSLIAAHLNHEWRETALRDEQFCSQLCQTLNIPFVCKKLSELPHIKYNGSKEEVARKARRIFFEQLAQEHNAQAIALAHHAQDQQETFFIRLLRGASLTGLTGMKCKEGLYIRPLLETNKAEILSYLHENESAYCVDETNESEAFLRNRIRKNVLPALHQADQRFDESFSATLKRLHETEDFLEQEALHHFAQLSNYKNGVLLVDSEKLLSLHSVMRYRCIVHWLCTEKVPFPASQAFFDELVRFLENDKKQHQIHHAWKITKTVSCVSITRT